MMRRKGGLWPLFTIYLWYYLYKMFFFYPKGEGRGDRPIRLPTPSPPLWVSAWENETNQTMLLPEGCGAALSLATDRLPGFTTS